MELTFLETVSLRYSYERKIVLDGIDIRIREGETIGILGPNGCGKTTLLKNLNKNLIPLDGSVLLDGDDLKDMPKKDIAKKIGVVPQTNEIRFAFTVRDIVAMGRIPFQSMMAGESDEDAGIIDDAIRKTGLEHLSGRHINTMSGGERQRVIIARAIAQTPGIILMDEPTLHLDISMQFDALDLIQGFSKEKGLAVVIVSHDLPMAARYCDRIVLIRDRKVHASGTPDEVLTPENMKDVFGVDAVYKYDEDLGRKTVKIKGSCG